MKLASRFGRVNQVRRDRPLTREELMHYVPSVFSENKHESRSDRYTWIPTITILDNLQREGFEPFFACQTRVRDQSRREHTKHMLRLRRAGQLAGQQVHPPQFTRWLIQLSDAAGIVSWRLYQRTGLRAVIRRSAGAA